MGNTNAFHRKKVAESGDHTDLHVNMPSRSLQLCKSGGHNHGSALDVTVTVLLYSLLVHRQESVGGASKSGDTSFAASHPKLQVRYDEPRLS